LYIGILRLTAHVLYTTNVEKKHGINRITIGILCTRVLKMSQQMDLKKRDPDCVCIKKMSFSILEQKKESFSKVWLIWAVLGMVIFCYSNVRLTDVILC